MAERLFICDVNLDGNAVKNAILEPLTAAPDGSKAGRLFYNASTGLISWFNGTDMVSAVTKLNEGAKDSTTDKIHSLLVKSTINGEYIIRAIKAGDNVTLSQVNNVITLSVSGLGISNIDGLSDALGGKLSTEVIATAADLGGEKASDDKLPTQKAVKTYVDTFKLTLVTARTPTEGYLKTYNFYQGGEDKDHLVGTIDLPKDLVVTGGSVVKGTFASDGITFTEDDKGVDKALKLIIANQTDPIYINAKDLIKDVVAGNGIDLDTTAGVNNISIKVDPTSESYLTVGPNGLKLSGIDNALKDLIGTPDDSPNLNTINAAKRYADMVVAAHMGQKFCCEAYAEGTTDNTPVAKYGDKEICSWFDFCLIDLTDNANTTTLVKPLMKNNLFRFRDGSGYAPTVRISQNAYDECMTHDLYDDASGTTLLYATSEYNPSDEWDIDKGLIKAGNVARDLYAKDGDTYTKVTHKLRPWETTETKYSIGIGNLDHDIYVLDNVKGASGVIWKGLFLQNTIWDGIDLSDYKLAPTVMSPTPIATVGDKAVCIFSLVAGESNCQGSAGKDSLINPFKESNRTYPRVNDCQQINLMNWCRANNADKNAPYPFAEGGYPFLDTYIIAHELLLSTRYIWSADRFGSGISSNDGVTADTYFKVGGVRTSTDGGTTWSYQNWNTGKTITIGGKSSGSNWSEMANNYYPKEQVMESQMAASMAAELGIQPTTSADDLYTFEFYGNTYYYMDVPETTSLLHGDMNCRVYKIVKYNYTDDTDGAVQAEFTLRFSLYGGAKLSGDVWQYQGGGAECIGTVTSGNGGTGNPIKLYVEFDQSKWVRDTNVQIAANSTFACESKYKYLGQYTNLGDSWALSRASYSPWKTSKASGGANGECYWTWDNNWWGSIVGRHDRLAFRFGCTADVYCCSPRSLDAFSTVSYTHPRVAGRAQTAVRIA